MQISAFADTYKKDRYFKLSWLTQTSKNHNSDVIMNTMSSHIAGVSIDW